FRRRTPSRGNRLTPVENGERADLRLYVVVLSGKSEVGKNLCRSGRALGQFHRQSPAALGIEAGRHRSTHRVDPFPKTDQPVPTLGGEPGQLGNHVVGHRDPQRVGTTVHPHGRLVSYAVLARVGQCFLYDSERRVSRSQGQIRGGRRVGVDRDTHSRLSPLGDQLPNVFDLGLRPFRFGGRGILTQHTEDLT